LSKPLTNSIREVDFDLQTSSLMNVNGRCTSDARRLSILAFRHRDLRLFITGGNMQLTEKHKQYWQKNLRLTGILLVIWFVATFVIGWFARDLESFTIIGFPFSFYMGAQGSLIIYVLIIWYYAHAMNKLDIEYGVHEGDE